jgi:hypothetical protein
MTEPAARTATGPRRPLFQKYFALAPLGARPLRRFAEAVSVFSVKLHDRELVPLPAAG